MFKKIISLSLIFSIFFQHVAWALPGDLDIQFYQESATAIRLELKEEGGENRETRTIFDKVLDTNFEKNVIEHFSLKSSTNSFFLKSKEKSNPFTIEFTKDGKVTLDNLKCTSRRLSLKTFGNIQTKEQILKAIGLSLEGTNFYNTTTLSANNFFYKGTGDVINRGKLQGHKLSLKANTLKNKGGDITAHEMNLDFQNSIKNKGSILGMSKASALTTQFINTGEYSSSEDAFIVATEIMNFGDLNATRNFKTDVSGSFKNSGQFKAYRYEAKGNTVRNKSKGDITITELETTLQTFMNKGKIETTSGTIETDVFINKKAFIAKAPLTWTIHQTFTNATKALFSTENSINFTGLGKFKNEEDGEFFSGLFSCSLPDVDNAGVIKSQGQITFDTLSGGLTNNGLILSENAGVDIQGSGFVKNGEKAGIIEGRNGPVKIKTTDFTNNGLIQSLGDKLELTITKGTNTNKMLAGKDVFLKILQSMKNTENGHIESGENFTSTQLDNDGTVIVHREAHFHSLENKGKIESPKIKIEKGHNRGFILGKQGLILTIQQELRNYSRISDPNSVKLRGSGSFFNEAEGILVSENKSVVMNELELRNEGTIEAKDTVNLRNLRWILYNGVNGLLKGEKLGITGCYNFYNLGKFQAKELLNPEAGLTFQDFDNKGSIHLTTGDLLLNLYKGQNRGTIYTPGLLTLNLGQTSQPFINQDHIEGGEITFLRGNSFVNKGKLISQGDLFYDAGYLTNEGLIDVALKLRIHATFMNKPIEEQEHTGWIQCGGDFFAVGPNISNNLGTILAKNKIEFGFGDYVNTGFIISEEGRINFVYTTLDNSGTLSAHTKIHFVGETPEEKRRRFSEKHPKETPVTQTTNETPQSSTETPKKDQNDFFDKFPELVERRGSVINQDSGTINAKDDYIFFDGVCVTNMAAILGKTFIYFQDINERIKNNGLISADAINFISTCVGLDNTGILNARQKLGLYCPFTNTPDEEFEDKTGVIQSMGTMRLDTYNKESENQGKIISKKELFVRLYNFMNFGSLGSETTGIDLCIQSCKNYGEISSQGICSFYGGSVFENCSSGIIYSLGNIVCPETVTFKNDGKIDTSESLEFQGKYYTLGGKIQAKKDINFSNCEELEILSDGLLATQMGEIKFDSIKLLQNQGVIYSHQQLLFPQLSQCFQRGNGLLQTQGVLTLNTGHLKDEGKGIFGNKGVHIDILNKKYTTALKGPIASTQGLVSVNAHSLEVQNIIDGKKGISITAPNTFKLHPKMILKSTDGDLHLNIGQGGNWGEIQTSGTLTLNLAEASGPFINVNHMAGGNIQLMGENSLYNKGNLFSQGDLHYGAGHLINEGMISASQKFTLLSPFTNTPIEGQQNTGRIQSLNEMVIDSQRKSTNTGVILARNKLVGDFAHLLNTGSLGSETGNSQLTLGQGKNTGKIHAHSLLDLILTNNFENLEWCGSRQGGVTLQGNGAFTNSVTGTLYSLGNLVAQEETGLANQGKIYTDANLELLGQYYKLKGKIQAKNNINLPKCEIFILSGGSFSANTGQINFGSLTQLENNGTIYSHQQLLFPALTKCIHKGLMQTQGQLTLVTDELFEEGKGFFGNLGVNLNVTKQKFLILRTPVSAREGKVSIKVPVLEITKDIMAQKGISIIAPNTFKLHPKTLMQSEEGSIAINSTPMNILGTLQAPLIELTGQVQELSSCMGHLKLNVLNEGWFCRTAKFFHDGDLMITGPIWGVAENISASGNITWAPSGDYQQNKFSLQAEKTLFLTTLGDWFNKGHLQGKTGLIFNIKGLLSNNGILFGGPDSKIECQKFQNLGRINFMGETYINVSQGSLTNYPGSTLKHEGPKQTVTLKAPDYIQWLAGFSEHTFSNIEGNLNATCTNFRLLIDQTKDIKDLGLHNYTIPQAGRHRNCNGGWDAPKVTLQGRKEQDICPSGVCQFHVGGLTRIQAQSFLTSGATFSFGKLFQFEGEKLNILTKEYFQYFHRLIAHEHNWTSRKLFKNESNCSITHYPFVETVLIHSRPATLYGQGEIKFIIHGKDISTNLVPNLTKIPSQKEIKNYNLAKKILAKVSNEKASGIVHNFEIKYPAYDKNIHVTGDVRGKVVNIKAPTLNNLFSAIIQSGKKIQPTATLFNLFQPSEISGPTAWAQVVPGGEFQIIPILPFLVPTQDYINETKNILIENNTSPQQELQIKQNKKNWILHQIKDWKVEEKKSVLLQLAGSLVFYEPHPSLLNNITSTSLLLSPSRIAIENHPQLRPGLRMLHHPYLQAELMQRCFMQNFGVGSLSLHIQSPLLLMRVLETEGYLQACRLHHRTPHPVPQNWENLTSQERLALQLHEILQPGESEKFKNPAIVYRLIKSYGELVLAAVATFPDWLRKTFQSAFGRIAANYLNLESTQSPVTLNTSIVSTDLVHIKSNKSMSVHKPILSTNVTLISKGNFINHSVIKAKEITDVEAGGYLLNWRIMEGGILLKRFAGGDIIDKAQKKYQGDKPIFIPAQAIGGTGIDFLQQDGSVKKFGLIFISKGKIRNIASWYSTPHGSSIFLDGDKGVEHLSLAESYVAYSQKKRSGFLKNKKKEVTIISNVIAQPKILSGGDLITLSKEGNLHYQGATVVAHDEDTAGIYGDILYSYLRTQDQKIIKKSSAWGLSKSKAHHKTQIATVTQLANGKKIHHISRNGKIHGQGVQITSPLGIFQSKKRVLFEDILLDHSLKESSSSLSPTLCGVPVLNLKQFCLENLQNTSLFNDLKGIGQSNGDVNKIIGGIQGMWNKASSMANAYRQGNLGMEIASHFGEVGLTYSKTKSQKNWQTSVPSILQLGSVLFMSEEGVDLLGGTQAHIGKYFGVRAPELTLGASTTKASSSSLTFTVGGGFNFVTYSGSVNASFQKANSHSTTHRNALVKIYDVNGTVDLGELNHLNLLGGNIITPNIKGHVKNVRIVSLQDEMKSSQIGASINTNFASGGTTGGGSFSYASSHIKQVNQHSGIEVTRGFTPAFSIENLSVTDTQLDPKLAKIAKSIHFSPLHDINRSISFSGGLSNLDLSNGQGFMNSLGKGLVTLGTGVVAAEVTRSLGGGDPLISLMGTLATGITSSQLNDHLGTRVNQPSSGIRTLGHITYTHGNRKVDVLGLDVSVPNFKATASSMGKTIEDIFKPKGEPKPVVTVEPSVKMSPALEELLESIRALDDIVVPRSWKNIPIEKISEKQAPSPSKSQNTSSKPVKKVEKKTSGKSTEQKENTQKDINFVRPEIHLPEYLSLPFIAQEMIQEASTLFPSAEERIEKRKRECFPTLTETLDVLYAPQQRFDEMNTEEDQIIKDPNSSFFERTMARLRKLLWDYNATELMHAQAPITIPSELAMGGALAYTDARSLVTNYFNGEKLDLQAWENLGVAAASIMTLGALSTQTGRKTLGKGAQAIGKGGKLVWNKFKKMTGVTEQEIPIYDKRWNLVPFVENPNTSHWTSAKISYARYLGEEGYQENDDFPLVAASLNFHPKAPAIMFTHGSKKSVQVMTSSGLGSADHRQLYKFIKKSGIKSKEWVLFSCNTGEGLDSIAENLARKGNFKVTAPTGILYAKPKWLESPFEMNIGYDPTQKFSKLGVFKSFYPEKPKPKVTMYDRFKDFLKEDSGNGNNPFLIGKPKKEKVPFVEDPLAGTWKTAIYNKLKKVGEWLEGKPIPVKNEIKDHELEALPHNNWTQNSSGTYVFVSHGSKKGIKLSTMQSSNPQGIDISFKESHKYQIRKVFGDHRVVRKLIEKDPLYKKREPVTLLACFGGGEGLPQNLANGLGAPVDAPTSAVYITSKDGIINLVMGKERIFKRYYPNPEHKKTFRKKKEIVSNTLSSFLKNASGKVKNPFIKSTKSNPPSKGTLKLLNKIKSSPKSDWRFEDLEKVGKDFGVTAHLGGKHKILQFPDKTQMGVSYSDKGLGVEVVKKFVKKLEELMKNDSGSIKNPFIRDPKIRIWNYERLNKHKPQPKKSANINFEPFVKDLKAGAWTEAMIGETLLLDDIPAFDEAYMYWTYNEKAPFVNVVAHGFPDSMLVRSAGGSLIPVNHRIVAKLINKFPGSKGKEIVNLFSCDTGRLNDGFAQHLINKLKSKGFKVGLAPSKSLWAKKDKIIIIDPADTELVNDELVYGSENLGEYRLFTPKKMTSFASWKDPEIKTRPGKTSMVVPSRNREIFFNDNIKQKWRASKENDEIIFDDSENYEEGDEFGWKGFWQDSDK